MDLACFTLIKVHNIYSMPAHSTNRTEPHTQNYKWLKCSIFRWINSVFLPFFLLCDLMNPNFIIRNNILSVLFISFSVKCTSSDSSSPSSSCTQCPCLLNEWAVNPAPELKCCDQLYLLPHELQKGELWHATMGRTVNIFQACCSKETVCLNNRCCSALDNRDRQESPLLKIWFGVTLVENL